MSNYIGSSRGSSQERANPTQAASPEETLREKQLGSGSGMAKKLVSNFESARTLASTARQESAAPPASERSSLVPEPRQFSMGGRRKKAVRKIWPMSTLTLERQPEGVLAEFDLYDEDDLPFLDRNTEAGRMVTKNIIHQNLDDDVMTDDDMVEAANKMLSREVEKAIKQFANGLDRSSIRNLKL